ncbi:unnamed protein product [Prorocentrum cordatum]|uniref:Uncharacterized protein n=1 Tax=Prorocentrum cordatum TaxID=2364126 RepID=A0ABN9WJU1_9DINO|nr:unnamed protein product [Polarella glacialis]
MVHVDLCGPSVDVFEYVAAPTQHHPDARGAPSLVPLCIFTTPEYAYGISPDAVKSKFLLSSEGGSPVEASTALRHLRPLLPRDCDEQPPPADELLYATPLADFLSQVRADPEVALSEHDEATVADAGAAFVRRLPAGTAVSVAPLAAAPEGGRAHGRVVRLLERGAAGELAGQRAAIPVGAGAAGPEAVHEEALRLLPAAPAPALSMGQMAGQVRGADQLFVTGARARLVGLPGEDASLNGAVAEILKYSLSSCRYNVRLEDGGDIRAFYPWHLEVFVRDEGAVREVLARSEPAARTVRRALRLRNSVPFTQMGDPGVVEVVQALLVAGLWAGDSAQEAAMSSMCHLARHPNAGRAIQLLEQQHALLDAPSAADLEIARSRAAQEARADPGLLHVLDRLELLGEMPTGRAAFGSSRRPAARARG